MEAALRALEELLPGANYLVDFRTIRVQFMPGWTPEQYIVAAVGQNPPLTKVAAIALPEVLTEVEYYLHYDRNQYYHLLVPPYRSQRFAALYKEVRAGLERIAADSTAIVQFWRDDPVEWQFSFLFIGSAGAVVFIGWGSD